jgi:hypothetical protein
MSCYAMGPAYLCLKVTACFCQEKLVAPFHWQKIFVEIQQLTHHPELDKTDAV